MSRDLILDCLCRDPRVCVPLSDIGPAVECDLSATWDHLAALSDAGMVEVWGSDDAFTVTLSAFAAARAGLRMSRDSERWLAPGERERPERCKPSGTEKATDAGIDPDDFADPATEPSTSQGNLTEDIAYADLNEEIEFHVPKRSGDYLKRPLQQPSRIHGSTAIWPLPGHRADDGTRMPPQATVGERGGKVRAHVGPCGGCGNAPFTVADYCCVCDRSGQDHLIPKPARRVAAPAKQEARFKAKGKAARKAG